LHDAAEAYLGDVIRPIKTEIGKLYKPLERRWMLTIAEALNCPELFDDEPPEVKMADRIALATEYRDNMPWEIPGVLPFNPDDVPCDARPLRFYRVAPFWRGKREFLKRWHEVAP
jgi:hypothetical protein